MIAVVGTTSALLSRPAMKFTVILRDLRVLPLARLKEPAPETG